MKPRVLCVPAALTAPFVVNIQQPLDILKKRGGLEYTVREEDFTFPQDISSHDCVLFFRNTNPSALKILYYSKLLGKSVIYGVDDNFFELGLSEYGSPMPEAKIGAHRRFMEKADLNMVYSGPMYERATALSCNVIKVVPGINLSLVEGLGKNRKDDRIRILYATSRGRDILSGIFASAVKRILREYKDRVRMTFIGYRPREFSGLPGTELVQPMKYADYMRHLATTGYDIGLAPLYDDIFHRSKTNTKFRDYGISDIAGVYSDVDVYSASVEDGVTGLLVENTEESWYNAIKKLVEDGSLRKKIQKSAHEFVSTHYDMERVAQELYENVGSLIRGGRGRGPGGSAIPFPEGVQGRFMDFKTPRIHVITTSKGDAVIDVVREIGRSCGYRTKFSTVSGNLAQEGIDPKIFSSDIIILGESPVGLRQAVTGAAVLRKVKVVICQDLPDASRERLAGLIDSLFYDETLKRQAMPYRYSARRLRMYLSKSRRFASRYFFKKTGLNKIERIFRERLLKPLKRAAG